MKLLTLLASTLIATSSFAGERYLCHQTDAESTYEAQQYSPYKIVLTQVGHDKIQEGKFFPFYLEVYLDQTKPIFETAVNMRNEDVMMKFTNTAKKVSGMIYLDEMDQAYLTVGNKKMHFDCR